MIKLKSAYENKTSLSGSKRFFIRQGEAIRNGKNLRLNKGKSTGSGHLEEISGASSVTIFSFLFVICLHLSSLILLEIAEHGFSILVS